MGEVLKTRAEREQHQVVEDMIDRGIADSESEALRRLIDAGAREYGYSAASYRDTGLRRVTRRVGWGFAIAALLWFGATLLLPVGYRLPGFGAAFASLAAFAIDRGLGRVEPGLSDRLRGFLPGGRA